MKHLDEYRDAKTARHLAGAIHREANTPRRYRLMEFCGGHTHAIFRYGLEDLLPANIEMVHGPGCPVCVLPIGRLDMAIRLAKRPGVILASYGDMLRVPGSKSQSLLKAKADGADIRIVYSTVDALKLAEANPGRDVIFFAIGFETTTPPTALAIEAAARANLRNFSVFCNHVTIIPGVRAILGSPDLRLDGFIGPGHVSTVIGLRPYRFIASDFRKPVVVSGFEPLDVLQGVYMILRQLADRRSEVENQYKRVVRDEGNPKALQVIAQTMQLRTTFEWRGLGFISQSALKLRPEFADFDAESRYEIPGIRVADPKACQCGEVLKGVIKPWECKVFGTACTPDHPIGTCMVSSEGACAAYFNYGRLTRRRGRAEAAADPVSAGS